MKDNGDREPLLDASGKVLVRNTQYAIYVGGIERIKSAQNPLNLRGYVECHAVNHAGIPLRMDDGSLFTLMIPACMLERIG